MHRYPAKLLLFGEHVLLLGAQALAVPVPAFGGQWDYRSPDTPMSENDMRLLEFARSTELRAVPGLDAKAFEAELGLGLFFDSDIPTGYGLGSSGALCAAVFDRFALEKTDDLAVLKSIFAGMESFFHGSSSGLDPLTSYLNQPLMVKNKTEVSVLLCQPWQPYRPVVFLVDTQLPRQTGPMVRWFQERNRDMEFRTRLHDHYLPMVELAVEAWQQGNPRALNKALDGISHFQFQELSPMIPASMKSLWQHSLQENTIRFKLCGAGGGGFLLGFATSQEAAKAAAGHHHVIFPFEKKHPHA